MSDNIAELLSHLPKAVRDGVVRATDVDKTLYPLASRGLTAALDGGIGRGRMTLVYGNPSAGKSLIMQESIGLWQKQGLSCAWVDAEEAFDPLWAARLGVDTDELLVVKKKSCGAVTDTVVPLLENGLDILVIDSISELLAEVFVDNDGGIKSFADQKQIGAHAKSLSMMINAMHYANKHTAIVFISQTTTKIENTYTKQVPHGGQKMLFAVSQIIKLTSSATEANQIKGKQFMGNKVVEVPVGRPVEFTVEKNKLGPQSRSGRYNIYYSGNEVGVDRTDELITIAVSYGAIHKAGAWFKFGEGPYVTGENQWQGQDELVKAVKADPALEAAIESELALALSGGVLDG